MKAKLNSDIRTKSFTTRPGDMYLGKTNQNLYMIKIALMPDSVPPLSKLQATEYVLNPIRLTQKGTFQNNSVYAQFLKKRDKINYSKL